MKILELITNQDGKLSTTATIQFIGAVVMCVVLLYSVYLNRSNVTDLFTVFAFYSAGGSATKGIVSVLSQNNQNK